MRVLDFKSFYEIYAKALLDDNQTTAVSSLFAPILNLHFFRNNYKDKTDTTPLIIDSKRASEWTTDVRHSVRNDVAKVAQSAAALSPIIKNFEDAIIPYELDDDLLDNMVKELLELVDDSDLDNAKKKQLKSLLESQETGEFLARVFIYSLTPKKNKSRTTTAKSVKSVEEYDRVVLRKLTKPKTVVPDDIDDTELDYVNALLDAYEEATGLKYDTPDDVIDTEYEDHFMQQRKNYYQAETIHRAIRDSVGKNDEDFDVLKEEIEDGIYTVAHKKYERGIDKADTVLDTAGQLPISNNTDKNMLGWVGPGERRGVCHMLVNDHKLIWVEDKKNGK